MWCEGSFMCLNNSAVTGGVNDGTTKNKKKSAFSFPYDGLHDSGSVP